MKQNLLQTLLRSTLIVVLTLFCVGLSAQGFINGHAYVDLGLPSGTKWATCNVGATSPEQYGSYFAWGETSPKSTYTWRNLKCCLDSEGEKFSKYVTNSKYGTVDNKEVLDLEDDAAHVNWGGTWRMPSKEQMEELCNTDNCTWTWTTQNGVYGRLVTSKRNGRSIFLPAAGFREDSSLSNAGLSGDYWSSSLCTSDPTNAYYLYFYSSFVDRYNYYRYFGLCVRPVCP